MTEFLTRRELREAERKGLVAPTQVSSEPVAPIESSESAALDSQAVATQVSDAEIPTTADISSTSLSEQDSMIAEIPSETASEPLAENSVIASEPDGMTSTGLVSDVVPEGLTRRQLRELEQSGKATPRAFSAKQSTSIELSPTTSPAIDQELPTAEEIVAIEISAVDNQLEATEIDLDMPSADFKGTNLLSEPSTQSIVLEVAPEAISLPLEAVETATTGSISILAEPVTGSITGGLDGLALDRLDHQDAVTGIITIVEPISALSIINERASVGVVPKSVLRRGWWRPWLIGLAGLLMAIAVILATITIINAVGA